MDEGGATAIANDCPEDEGGATGGATDEGGATEDSDDEVEVTFSLPYEEVSGKKEEQQRLLLHT